MENSNGYTVEINEKFEDGSIYDTFNTFILFLKGCGYTDDAIKRCINLDEIEV
jgi:hypothetical protein